MKHATYVAHLADLFGVCATCAPLWSAWYVRKRPAANVHCVQIRRACIERQRTGVACVDYVPGIDVRT